MLLLTVEILYSGLLVIDVGAFYDSFHLPEKGIWDGTLSRYVLIYGFLLNDTNPLSKGRKSGLQTFIKELSLSRNTPLNS